jgi:NADH-quinone oxidoreductase subunit J
MEMSLEFMIEVALIGFLILFAILAVELKKLAYAVVSLGLMSTVLSIIFYVLYAPYVAVINLLVYAGAVIVLFLAVLSLMSPGEKGKREEMKYDIATEVSGGLLFIIIAILMVQVFIASYVGLHFVYGEALNLPVLKPFQNILENVAQSVWQVRIIDVLIQAMALFVAGLGVATLFRRERGEKE